MKVAGLGFRKDVTLASLREALVAAGGSDGSDLIGCGVNIRDGGSAR